MSTTNSLKEKELKETKRHNEATESLTRRGQDTQLGGKLGSATVKSADKLLKVGSKLFNAEWWYNSNPTLTEDVAKFPYNVAAGTPIRKLIPYSDSYSFTAGAYQQALPGPVALYFTPTIGSATGQADDPINTACRLLNAFITSNLNRVPTDYDPVDLMQVILAWDSLFMWIGVGKKLYSISDDADIYNKYKGQATAEILGFDLDSIVTQRANFRERLNTWITKVNAFNVPAQFAYFIRHYWMVVNAWKDKDLNKSGEFHFMPRVVYKYNEASGALDAIPTVKQLSSNLVYGNSINSGQGVFRAYSTVDDYFNVLKELYNSIAESQTISQMSGNIRTAFANAVFQVDYLSEDFHIEPIYAEDVLNQIRNATMVGAYQHEFSDSTTFMDHLPRIYQDGSGFNLKQSFPRTIQASVRGATDFVKANGFDYNYQLFNISDNSQSQIQNLVSSRFMAAGSLSYSAELEVEPFKRNSNTTDLLTQYSYFGSEIINFAIASGKVKSSNGVVTTLCTLLGPTLQQPTYSDTTAGYEAFTLTGLRPDAIFSFYSYLPRIFVFIPRNDTVAGDNASPVNRINLVYVRDSADLDNVVIIDSENIANMHEVALLSLFDLSNITKYTVKDYNLNEGQKKGDKRDGKRKSSKGSNKRDSE